MSNPHIINDLQSLAQPVTMFDIDPMNANTDHDLRGIAASLKAHKQRTPIVAKYNPETKRATIEKGHGTFVAAVSILKWDTIAAVLVQDELQQAINYGIADNLLNRKSHFDDKMLAMLVQDAKRKGGGVVHIAGMTDDAITALINDNLKPANANEFAEQVTAVDSDGEQRPLVEMFGAGGVEIPREETKPTKAQEYTKLVERLIDKWGVTAGTYWKLGRHRFLIADSTGATAVAKLAEYKRPDVLVSDPPYASGGFQEAQKTMGSIGTRDDLTIRRDMISSRGYSKLMQAAMKVCRCNVTYMFTDWKMWNTLYDASEASGYRVRNMIVWDKQTPGMGAGWRGQHELVQCCIKADTPFSSSVAQGNVLRHRRTGNQWHPTEKPVDLIIDLLKPTPDAAVVLDMFAGSGTVLLAAEKTGRIGLMVDEWVGACAIAIERWHQMTGKKPELIE